jgi:hypothetical protein
MREITQKAIDVAQFGNQLKSQPALSEAAFKRVKVGVDQSQESKPKLQTYLKKHGEPPPEVAIRLEPSA